MSDTWWLHGVPEAHTLSDMSIMAPWRIIPSLCPLLVLISAALTTCTSAGILAEAKKRL